MSWRTPEELGRTPIHVLVRDCPETLAVLRAAGIDVRAHGTSPLGEVVPPASVLIDDVARSILWRKSAPPRAFG
jgi:hypothetical protein